MSSTIEIASAFIQGAPPGELQDVVNDIQTLTSGGDGASGPSLLSQLKPAFQQYNEEQLAATTLPGSQRLVRFPRPLSLVRSVLTDCQRC
jgi:capping protein (actin filament) muscle Z-line, alpha